MSQEARKPGRPPSAAARRKALAAARTILMEEGLGRLSIEAVARASGVGKPTIYRNWANLQELAMEALTAAGQNGVVPDPALPPEAALEAQLARLVASFASTRGRQITIALASADPESEFTRAFRNRVILSARAQGRALLEAAIAAEGLSRPPEMEVVLDMIYGPLFFRILAGHRPLDKDFAAGLARAAFALLRAL